MTENIIHGAKITALTNMGAGITRDTDGKTLFVEGAVTGDICDVSVTASKKNYSTGRLARLIVPSPHRISPDCDAYALGCGGCAFRHVAYEHELEVKRAHIARLLAFPELKIISAGEHEPRTKVTLPIGSDGRIGYYKKGTHTPVPCVGCRLHSELTNAILAEAEQLLKAYPTSHFHHIRLRHGTEGTMLILLSADASDLDASRAVFEAMREKFPELVSGYFCQNKPALTHGRHIHIGGDEKIRDRLAGCEFLISPDAFYQVNHGSAELLYTLAAEYADVKNGQSVADLYCGTGTIGISVIKRSGADAELFGIEIVQSAVRDARENAVINGAPATFISCDAAEYDRRADVVIVDPPRAGCDAKLIEHLKRILPERIVYVSCDPATLARDVKLLGEHYRISKATAVDMFPRTCHCETVCLLSKLNTKQHIEVELNMDELDLTSAESKATYEEIKEYVLEHTGLKVSHLNIAQIKRKHGIIERANYNLPKSEDAKQPVCPPEKEKAITEALKFFGMIL